MGDEDKLQNRQSTETVPSTSEQLLAKIMSLPTDQQYYLEIIIDGLGAGKTKQQRRAAKNTVMTILGIVPSDMTLLRQIQQLSPSAREDVKSFIQEQLQAEPEMESLVRTPVSSTLPSELSESPETHPVEVTSAAEVQMDSVAMESTPTEALPQMAESDAETSPDVSNSEAVSEISAVEPDSTMATGTVDIAETEIPEMATMAEEPEVDNSRDSALSEAETNEQPSLADEERAARELVEAQARENYEKFIRELEELDNVTDSKTRIHISTLGNGLLISTDQEIKNLHEVIDIYVGMKFRNVYGLFKSEDKHAVEHINPEKLMYIIMNGMIVDNVRYPVEYEVRV
ncbi:MAG: hypothetical protein HQM11_14880 [SAR324 cluster bacterium]|nr:hypothetical protein [SAR324 cluster bacterium]